MKNKRRRYIEKTTEKEKLKVLDDIIARCRHERDNDNCILFYIYDIDCYECPLFHVKKSYETRITK